MESTEYIQLEKLVYNYKTRNEAGFTAAEEKELLKQFPNISMDKYYDAMRGNTCMMGEGGIITYHCDILKALICGLENRELTLSEWD
jgi:hypothetical protein